MKQDQGKATYGIYIDRRQAFIFTSGLLAGRYEPVCVTVENPAEAPRSNKADRDQVHLQNEKNEQLRKFCRLIIEHLEHPHKVLIFGPSMSKFELQKEIAETKRFRHIEETLKKSEVMTKEQAARFVREYFGL